MYLKKKMSILKSESYLKSIIQRILLNKSGESHAWKQNNKKTNTPSASCHSDSNLQWHEQDVPLVSPYVVDSDNTRDGGEQRRQHSDL